MEFSEKIGKCSEYNPPLSLNEPLNTMGLLAVWPNDPNPTIATSLSRTPALTVDGCDSRRKSWYSLYGKMRLRRRDFFSIKMEEGILKGLFRNYFWIFSRFSSTMPD
jgi:hypothetical protein